MHIFFEHVTFAYNLGQSGQQNALHDVCLTLDTTQIIGICGVTGSGKSTFIQHLNGILKPDSGRILVDEEDIHRSKDALRQIRQRIGMTFQFPERQLFGRTVWEELSYTLKQHQISETEIERRIISVCELLKFDVQLLRDRSPFSLSRGEQRKLGSAVMLTLQPELLVLDEPTAGMDRANAYRFLDLLQALHDRQQSQLMLVSHDIELLLKYVEHLIVLHHGEILFTGTSQQLIRIFDQLDAFGISLPPVYRTLYLLHKIYPQLPLDVNSLDQAVEKVARHIPTKNP